MTRTGVTMTWAERAACRGMDTALFYSDGTGQKWRAGRPPKTGKQRITVPQALIDVCNRCPVRPDCLEHALQHLESGWWGGTTEHERKTMWPLGVRRRRLETGMHRFTYRTTNEEQREARKRRREDTGK